MLHNFVLFYVFKKKGPICFPQKTVLLVLLSISVQKKPGTVSLPDTAGLLHLLPLKPGSVVPDALAELPFSVVLIELPEKVSASLPCSPVLLFVLVYM